MGKNKKLSNYILFGSNLIVQNFSPTEEEPLDQFSSSGLDINHYLIFGLSVVVVAIFAFVFWANTPTTTEDSCSSSSDSSSDLLSVSSDASDNFFNVGNPWSSSQFSSSSDSSSESFESSDSSEEISAELWDAFQKLLEKLHYPYEDYLSYSFEDIRNFLDRLITQRYYDPEFYMEVFVPLFDDNNLLQITLLVIEFV